MLFKPVYLFHDKFKVCIGWYSMEDACWILLTLMFNAESHREVGPASGCDELF